MRARRQMRGRHACALTAVEAFRGVCMCDEGREKRHVVAAICLAVFAWGVELRDPRGAQLV